MIPASESMEAQEANNLHVMGQQSLMAGQLASAEQFFLQAIEKDPFFLPSLLDLGALLLRHPGDVEKAEAAYRHYLTTHKDDDIYIINTLAWIVYSRGDFAEAEQLYLQAIATNKEDMNTLTNLAQLFSRLSRRVEAEQLYRRAIESNAQSAIAHYNLAAFLVSGNDRVEEAVKSYQLSLKIDPDFVPSLCGLGVLLANEPASAEGLFRRAIKADPGHAPSLNALGSLQMDRGKDEAELLFRSALAIDPKCVPALHNLGDFYFKVQGKYAEAEVQYRAVIEHADADAYLVAARFNLGEVLLAKKEYEEAAVELRATISSCPQHFEALTHMAYIAATFLNDPEEAERLFRAALLLRPSDLTVATNLAYLFWKMGTKSQEAEDMYRYAVAANPNSAVALYNLAVVLKHSSKDAESRQMTLKCLALDPQFQEATALMMSFHSDPDHKPVCISMTPPSFGLSIDAKLAFIETPIFI